MASEEEYWAAYCRYLSLQIQGSQVRSGHGPNHEIISKPIVLPSADSRRVVVSYKRKYVHKVLVNRLVKLAQEKCMNKSTDSPNMTISVDWDIKHQNKQAKLLKKPSDQDPHCFLHSM